jgi:hypothetical protein
MNRTICPIKLGRKFHEKRRVTHDLGESVQAGVPAFDRGIRIALFLRTLEEGILDSGLWLAWLQAGGGTAPQVPMVVSGPRRG